MNFTYQSFAIKVYFGDGQLKNIDRIIGELGGSRLFVVSTGRTQSIVDKLTQSFGQKNVFHFKNVVQHVPKRIVVEAALLAAENQSNLIVAIGGGSAIGLAKGIALENRIPILAVPTSYAGSEMTNIYGISSEGVKTVGRDPAVLPKAVLYDPYLTIGMPISLAATSSMNAMAHLVEALYAFDTNPITYQLSLMGIKLLREGMELLIAEKSLANANTNLQFGSYFAGKALCEVATSLHHKAAHVLGGSFEMDHSKVHTVLLPYVLEFQMAGLSDIVVNDLRQALSDQNPARKLRTLAQEMGAATTLQAIGFNSSHLSEAAEMIAALKFPNPVGVSRQGIETLLRMAYDGTLRLPE